MLFKKMFSGNGNAIGRAELRGLVMGYFKPRNTVVIHVIGFGPDE